MTGNRLKILVIDDDEQFLEKIEVMMKLIGISIMTCREPDKALQAYKSDTFNLVITDITMPEMNGFQILDEIRKLDSGASVIVLTGNPDEDTKRAAMSNGAKAFLTKPLDLALLQETITRIVR